MEASAELPSRAAKVVADLQVELVTIPLIEIARIGMIQPELLAGDDIKKVCAALVVISRECSRISRQTGSKGA